MNQGGVGLAAFRLRGLRLDRDRLIARLEHSSEVGTELESLRAHHPESWEHCRRVALKCTELAHELYESPVDRDCLALAGLLHDVGKLCVSGALLDKPGGLAEHERGLVQLHSIRGYEMLTRLDHHPARVSVLQHHCHVENAYPDPESISAVLGEGWSEGDLRFGDEMGQVIAVVDMFDALTHRRSYKEPSDRAEVESTVRRSYRGDARYIELVAARGADLPSGVEGGGS